MNTMVIALIYPGASVPTVLFHFAEKLIANHHLSATGLMMIQLNKPTITKLRPEVGNVLRENMGVDIDGEHWKRIFMIFMIGYEGLL
jgi:hypothetical protein